MAKLAGIFKNTLSTMTVY